MKTLIDDILIKIRTKTKRDRIKLRRAKRNNKRFYYISSDGKIRARKSKNPKFNKYEAKL